MIEWLKNLYSFLIGTSIIEEIEMRDEVVLVTGGSGFVGAHCILQLVRAGYRVRTTVRSLKREADVRAMLKVGGIQAAEELSFVAADLTSDKGWPEAVAGCDYVLHVASPFPATTSKNEDELIVPAREGALRVLRAARDAGVKRVVLTSSFAAISYGHKQTDQPFSEQDWTDLSDRHVSPYAKSKTLAEQAAWNFMANDNSKLELAVINPVAIFGPVLGSDYSSSIQFVQRLLTGSIPAIPHLAFNVVDVRDVADIHLRAMTNPIAKGERFLASAGAIITLSQVAQVLRSNMGDVAKRVTSRELPDWLVRTGGLVNPTLAAMASDVGKLRRATNEKARRVLGWEPRSNEDAIIATAESLVQLGLVQNMEKEATA
jgi:nucleoside-diphosphate-sugar epimerase